MKKILLGTLMVLSLAGCGNIQKEANVDLRQIAVNEDIDEEKLGHILYMANVIETDYGHIDDDVKKDCYEIIKQRIIDSDSMEFDAIRVRIGSDEVYVEF